MTRTMATASLCILIAVTLSWATGCAKKKSEASPTVSSTETSKPAEATPPPAPAAAAADSKPTTESEKAAPVAAAPTKSPAKPGSYDRATLEKAFLEIWCAQRKGETEKLLDIYTKYGFTEPKAWTEAWTEAAKDGAWVATITQDAMRQCP